MAGKSIEMSKLRNVIKLHLQGKSKVFISQYLGISRNTVKKYIRQFSALKMPYEEIELMSDLSLEALFINAPERELPEHLQALYAFFPYAGV